MSTLSDYIKGKQPIELVSKFGKLMLCKFDDKYFYMDGEEVVDREWYPNDTFYDRTIDLINHRNEEEALDEIQTQRSYKHWVKFVKERTGEQFEIKRSNLI